MNIKQALMGLALAVVTTVCAKAQQVSLIPLPAEMTVGSGSFVWKNGQKLVYPAYAGDSVKTVCQRFAADFEKATGVALKLKKRGRADVELALDKQLGPEAYHLTTGPDGSCATRSSQRPTEIPVSLNASQSLPTTICATSAMR